MKFTSAKKVQEHIHARDETERLIGENRVKIQNMANSFPPMSKAEQVKTNLRINVEWGEFRVIFQRAMLQCFKAFQEPAVFFRVTLPTAPPHKKFQWQQNITQFINRPLKNSSRLSSLLDYKWSTVILHGIGPQMWYSPDGWCPKFVSLDDLRVQTDTDTDLDNMEDFAVRCAYTPGELARKVFGEYADEGWNKPAIKSILKAYHNTSWEKTAYDWADNPEKMAELYRQNPGFYEGQAMPTIPLWHFYFKDEDPKKGDWHCRVVPDKHVRGLDQHQDAFLYKSSEKFADDLSNILHVQFGDFNAKAPFKWHSVRSLGFLMMEPCYWMNLFRSRALQHTWENMNILFRSSDPADRSRIQKLELFDRGFIPEGVNIVPQDQRHQVDGQMLQFVMGNLRQLMAEGSVSYTQQLDTGTQKEQTAYETAVKAAMANVMLSGMLSKGFKREISSWREICRRFTNPKSDNRDIKKFIKQCRDAQIPTEFLDVDLWDIEPEIPIGSGNPVAEHSKVQALMEARPLFSPEAQDMILHRFASVITGNPKEAQLLAPIGDNKPLPQSAQGASAQFGTLMTGAPVPILPGHPADQIEMFIALLSKVIADDAQAGMSTPERVRGMITVAQHIEMLLSQLDQIESEKQRARLYHQQLGKLMNTVKAFQQRLAEQAQAGNSGMSAEAQAKIAETMAVTQVKLEAKQAADAQKLSHKQIAFENEQQRKDAETVGEIQREHSKVLLAPQPTKSDS